MNRPTVARSSSILTLLALAAAACSGQSLRAQSTKLPSTLRYGSGFLDAPVASVLPHMAVTGTWSGFSVDIPSRPIIGDGGTEVGRTGEPFSRWYNDASVAVGLFDRLEVGTTFQSFADAGSGGNMVGTFGRAVLLEPGRSGGLGLAVGARYVTSPTLDDVDPNGDFEPGRLGFPDQGLQESYAGPLDGVDTNFSPYVVGSVVLPGFEARLFPEHDLTFALGWGDGMFRDGGGLEHYAPTRSKGWFFGSAVHVQVAEGTVLNVVADYNGFDVNLGAQLDWGGVRVGGHVLGANYETDASRYRTKKYGVVASVALCPSRGGLCEPELVEREPRGPSETARMPAPPPDTVVVERGGTPPPTGRVASLCLATGHDVEVLVTARGDTLVGPDRVPIEELRPGVVFAGTYADERAWFTEDEPVTLSEREYRRSGGEVRRTCGEIRRVGEHEGVPLFTDVEAEEPYETLYVPVRPGVWQAYEAGLRGTRG